MTIVEQWGVEVGVVEEGGKSRWERYRRVAEII